MILTHLEEITDTTCEKFFNRSDDGVLIIRNKVLAKEFCDIVHNLNYKNFSLKNHQHINNGQMEYSFSLVEIEHNTMLKKILFLNSQIREKLEVSAIYALSYNLTLYPKSTSGSLLHQDFSHNRNCIVTFFFGETEFLVADSRDGDRMRKYPVENGDILIMRAPRDGTEKEKNTRPIHGIGVVKEPLYTLEVRELYVA